MANFWEKVTFLIVRTCLSPLEPTMPQLRTLLSSVPSAAQSAILAKRSSPAAHQLKLQKLRCEIFQTSFNPNSDRTGAKYLRARLRGPSMINYYPAQLSIRRVNGVIKSLYHETLRKDRSTPPPIYLEDAKELQRVEDVAALKARGKGKPKKATTKGMLSFCSRAHGAYAKKKTPFPAASRRAKKRGGPKKK